MKKRPLIGVVIPLISKIYIGNLLRGIIRQAGKCGCDLLILSPLTNFCINPIAQTAAEADIFELIRSDCFDGFLYIRDDPTMGRELIDRIEQLLAASNKYVMGVDEQENSAFDCTQYDDYYDFCKVVEHLVQEHKYKKIYCLTGPKTYIQAQTRLQAYTDIMNKYGLYYDDSYISYGTFWVDSAHMFAKRIISGELARPEAVVCGNDVTAMALIKCFQGAGIRVPEDIAVTGYDGFPFNANVDVTLTTYLRNHFQLGADAMRRLYRNITGRLCEKVSRPDNGFIIGSSCGCRNIPAHQLISNSSDITPRMWQETVFGDNLIYDLSTADTVDALLRCALSHSNILYSAERVDMYLTEGCSTGDLTDCGNVSLRASFTENGVQVGDLGSSFSRFDAARFISSSGESSAVYLSPLHMGSCFFGYIALSFSEPTRVYDMNYLCLVSGLNISLGRLLCTDDRSRSNRSAAARKKKVPHSDELTELRRKLSAVPEEFPNIDAICAAVNMSRSSLQKNYRACFGVSIFDELIRFRIEKARRLLSDTSFSITEISVMCGYSSDSYFMKQFKKLTGLTPSEYRARE